MEFPQVHNLTESRHHLWPQSNLVFSICLLSSLSSICMVSLYAHRLYRNKKSQHPAHEYGSIGATHKGIAIDKMQVILSSISHHRMVPVSHGFIYAYLAVGIPVRSPASNWLLSVDDSHRWWNRGWLHVFARDHLHRGRDGPTLSANLDGYLREEGLDPSEYPHAYLVTAPCLFGYRFSPASFWYLYTPDRQLRHVIAEVNNTFSERRVYLFSASKQYERTDASFSQTHQKDFHVSPFNSRKGSYVLSTSDPVKDGEISITITLKSSKGDTKLVARWWSDTPAIDPACLSIFESLRLLAAWGWTVLITYPRIVFQAIWLAQVCRIHIWYRPEPRESAIPRAPTTSEAFLGAVLARYFEHIVKASATDSPRVGFALSYPGIDGRQLHSKMKSTGAGTSNSLRIHAPQFYRRAITYETLTELLRDTLLDPYPENRSAWSDDGDGLVAAVRGLECQMSQETYQTAPGRKARSPSPLQLHGLETCALYVLWAIHAQLRRVTPLPGVYPDPGLPTSRGGCPSSSRSMDHSEATLSQSQAERSPLAAHSTGNQRGGRRRGGDCFLDRFVRNHTDTRLQLSYMLITLQLQWRTALMSVLGGE